MKQLEQEQSRAQLDERRHGRVLEAGVGLGAQPVDDIIGQVFAGKAPQY